MANSLVVLFFSILSSTFAVSCICGTALGETKLPKSIQSNAWLRINWLMYVVFFSVGIKCIMPWMASRGHSTNCTFSLLDIFPNLPCYDHFLYRTGSFANRTQLGIPKIFFCRIILRKTISTMDLHTLIGHFHSNFGSVILGHR